MMTTRTRMTTAIALAVMIICIAGASFYTLTSRHSSGQSHSMHGSTTTTLIHFHWATPPSTPATTPPSTSPYDLPAYESLFSLVTSGGISGDGSGIITIGLDGKWTLTHGPMRSFELMASGVVNDAELSELKKYTNKDSYNLFLDKSLIAQCKPVSPDEITSTYIYTSDGDNEVSFDSCWVGANQDQKLIQVTQKVLANIWMEAGLR